MTSVTNLSKTEDGFQESKQDMTCVNDAVVGWKVMSLWMDPREVSLYLCCYGEVW
jgi:hypothetical protein